MKKLVYIGFEFPHHKNSKGGYHHIKNYLNYDKIVNVQHEMEFPHFIKNHLIYKVIRKIRDIILGQGVPISIIKLILLNNIKKNIVFHFIYPENTFKWLCYFKRPYNKIVFTVHQPFTFYDNETGEKLLNCADDIIVLKQSDVGNFSDFIPNSNVHYIPHGIDVNYFKPSDDVVTNNQVLMVGNWLRNFELASEVFKLLNKYRPDIQISVVSNEENFKYFKNITVEFYNKISNDKLLKLYQQSKVVYFPLHEFTANNALLEASSTGANILLATNDYKDWTYLPKEHIKILNTVPEDNCDKIISAVDNYNGRNENLVKYIHQNYSWCIISEKIEKILKNS